VPDSLKLRSARADKQGETQYGSAGQNNPAAYLRERTRVGLGQGGTM